MTKEEFIDFIKELGFTQTWHTNPNLFSMGTDMFGQPNKNLVYDQLNLHFDDKHELVQLSLSQMSSHLVSGKNFGNFSLKTFGDKNDIQLEIFISFIKGSFKEVPKNITQYIRDNKIKNILK
jgi:hypothetical protein